MNDMGASYTPEEWDAWTDRMKAEHKNGNGHGKSLSIEAQRLLPTIRTDNNTNRQSEKYGAGRGNFHHLVADAALWGDYTEAIHRWESLSRPAPPPVVGGQLSPAFMEWMMGLDAGHVSDVPISSREQRKALGNGVVPQQAEAAIRFLLPRMP